MRKGKKEREMQRVMRRKKKKNQREWNRGKIRIIPIGRSK